MTVKQAPSAREALGSTAEVAEYLGIPEKTLKQWRWEGKGPRYRAVGRHIRYMWPDVDEWLDGQAKGGPSDVAQPGSPRPKTRASVESRT